MQLMRTLKQIGYTNIYTATTYTKALELSSICRFDMMFADIDLQDTYDGIDTVKALQKVHNLAVIFITAYDDEDTLSRVAEVEFIGYLLKPYRIDELKALISIAIKKFNFHNTSSIKISGNYRFDLSKNIFYEESEVIILTKKEKFFFSLIFNNQGVTISYIDIDEIVWNGESVSDNTRRMFIYRIKKRFPTLQLHTVNNIGIKLI